jgi:myo-inositol-1(or 4)-monophosphatase
VNFLDSAVEIAREAGALLVHHFERRPAFELKGDFDLVTAADRASEALIVERLRSHFPAHNIVAEEGGGHESASEYRWYVDPLDGTTNFAHGFPMYNVSIGVEYEGACVLGVVFDPTRNELFLAQKGKGATLNGTPIHVSVTPKLNEALLVTGFAYDVHTAKDNNLKEFCAFTVRTRGIRRTGTAAIDLCYIACGRFDGFWELQLNPWDTAAGKIMVEEAGGKMTNYQGEPYSIYGNTLIATNGHIHQEMIEVLKETRSTQKLT